VDVVSSEIQRFAQKHEERRHLHENFEAIQLLDNMGIVRRLQRKKPFELVEAEPVLVQVIVQEQCKCTTKRVHIIVAETERR
jgi:hypothetical protein